MWVPTEKLPRSAGHPFYERLNRVLEKAGFDGFVEGLCARFYAERLGRPSLRPGRYFRMLLIGYFEGLDSERAIGWRVADSMSVRAFLEYDPEEAPPDHSTLSRTRRLIDVETHRAVFTWVLERLSEAKLVRGRTIGIDATTLEANAAMRSIVRRDTGEGYEAFVKRLAEASGVETPTRADLARFDRKRKKKTSSKEWKNPHDPDAKITKMKDGRTRLAHKAEAAVDLETGAVVAVTVQGAEAGDTKTMDKTLRMAREEVSAVQPGAEVREVVADKGIPQYENRVGLEATGIAKLRVRTGAEGTTTLEGAGGRPTGRLRQPAAPSWRARPAIAAPAERTGGTTVCPQARDRRAAPDLRSGPSQCAQTTAGARVRIQSGPLDAPADRFRDAPQPSGQHGGIYWGAIGPLEQLGAFAEALLRVDPPRSVDSRVPNPSLRYLNVNVRIEH